MHIVSFHGLVNSVRQSRKHLRVGLGKWLGISLPDLTLLELRCLCDSVIPAFECGVGKWMGATTKWVWGGPVVLGPYSLAVGFHLLESCVLFHFRA